MRSNPFVWGGVALALGCSESPSPVTDAAPRSDALTDAVFVDVPRGPGPLAPMSTPQRVPVARWVVASFPNAAAAADVYNAIEDQTFTLPADGPRYGSWWGAGKPSENGVIEPMPTPGLLYAVTEYEAPPGMYTFMRADRVATVYANDAVEPGDIYGSGKVRVPVHTEDGRALVTLRAVGGRGAVSAEFFATPDELYFNADDITTPDLVAGDQSEQYVGVAMLNLTDAPALDAVASVEENDVFESTTVNVPSLPAESVTQVAFRLMPKQPHAMAGRRVTVGLRVGSPSLRYTYRREITLESVAAGATHKRTFRSVMDGSAQYYGVVPPTGLDAARAYGLVLSLHGASVEGIGQARAYSAKDWAYVIAPTNRRPFGFDWEEWGRRDAIESLEHATGSFRIDPTRVYLTGHSMGGHGTWNVGVHFPGRFATIGPSAGWGSFQSYQGTAAPRGAFARSQAASNTQGYLSNLTRRGAYVIHGTADDNVPVRESRALVPALRMFAMDVEYHEEPGAGHWWDGDRSPGADCVDWPPLFDFMRAHTLDPWETDFRFTTPGPWVNPTHSFVTVRSVTDPMMDAEVSSARTGDTVSLTTRNVRSMTLAGGQLRSRGIMRLVVDGRAVELTDGTVAVGPQEGKRPGVHGPFNESLQRPFCFVYPAEGPPVWRRYASYLVSAWNVIGNGQGCAVPSNAVTPSLRRERNLVYVGVAPARVTPRPQGVPFNWGGDAIALGAESFADAALFFVLPGDGERLDAVLATTAGDERLLFRIQPFASGFAIPDYVVLARAGVRAAGFFNADWTYRPAM